MSDRLTAVRSRKPKPARTTARRVVFSPSGAIDEGFVAEDGWIVKRTSTGHGRLIPVSAVELAGRHMLHNVIAATAVASIAGVEPAAMQDALPASRVVGAFQNLPAKALGELDEALGADVIVCGDDADAVRTIVELTASVDGLHGIDGGPLVNAAAVEALTAVLLTVNRARKAEHGIRVVELRRPH